MPSWRIGDVIAGRWEVFRVLRGGMGIVYVVYDRQWGEAFAAKTFQENLLRSAPDAGARFEREALTWIQLDAHPNIAEARFLEWIEGQPLLFVEYVSGGDLASWIGTPRLVGNPAAVLRLAIQFCDGMTHTASRQLVAHRDVKPANCLLTSDAVLKITDFGLAKVFDGIPVAESKDGPSISRGTLTATRTGYAAGTPAYMPPEQFEDVKHVDVRADIYAFGVMLFEMFSGRLPFTATSFPHFAWMHQNQPPPRLTTVPPAIAGILEQCLAKNASERFSDFTALRAELASTYRDETGEEPPEVMSGIAFDAVRLNNKALSLRNLGRIEEALDAFDRSLAANPASAKTWCNKAAALGEDLGLWNEALACCERAIETDPSEPMAWSNRGMALRALGQRDAAMTAYARAIELEPDNATIWSNRANTLNELGRAAEALASIDRAIDLDPRGAATWSNRGVILGATDSREALSCHETALEIDQHDARLWVNHAQALLALERYEEALQSLEHALLLRPRLKAALVNKGAALRGLGRASEAVECYEKAIAVDPGYVLAWSNLGNAMLECNRMDEALACYEKALTINPDHGMSWFNKGSALLRGERLDDALLCFETAARHGVTQAGRLIDAIRRVSP